MDAPDPMDKWSEPTEITGVSFSGKLRFSCCRKVQGVEGEGRSEVRCERCGTVYGLALLVRLQSEEGYRFAPGTRVRLKGGGDLEVKVGSTNVVLKPSGVYEATQDTHGLLNVPPGYQTILVHVQGDRGLRRLVALVPEDRLEEV